MRRSAHFYTHRYYILKPLQVCHISVTWVMLNVFWRIVLLATTSLGNFQGLKAGLGGWELHVPTGRERVSSLLTVSFTSLLRYAQVQSCPSSQYGHAFLCWPTTPFCYSSIWISTSVKSWFNPTCTMKPSLMLHLTLPLSAYNTIQQLIYLFKTY